MLHAQKEYKMKMDGSSHMKTSFWRSTPPPSIVSFHWCEVLHSRVAELFRFGSVQRGRKKQPLNTETAIGFFKTGISANFKNGGSRHAHFIKERICSYRHRLIVLPPAPPPETEIQEGPPPYPFSGPNICQNGTPVDNGGQNPKTQRIYHGHLWEVFKWGPNVDSVSLWGYRAGKDWGRSGPGRQWAWQCAPPPIPMLYFKGLWHKKG